MSKKRARNVLCFLIILLCLPVYAERSMTVYYQTDYTDTLITLNNEDRSVASSGCWAAVAAMLISYYHGEEITPPDPEEVFMQGIENNLYNGKGMGIGSLMKLLEYYGLVGELRRLPSRVLEKCLNYYGPVGVYVGPGRFTKNGHYIIIESVSEDHHVQVYDPNSRAMSRDYYYIGEIMAEASGDTPYMVFYGNTDELWGPIEEDTYGMKWLEKRNQKLQQEAQQP